MPDGTKNLQPVRSKEEARERGRNGGIASGVARRRKRALREAIDLYLSLPVSDQRRKKKLSEAGLDDDDIDNQMSIIMGLAKAAERGDSKAATVLFNQIGPEQKEDSALEKVDELMREFKKAVEEESESASESEAT